MVWFFSQLCIKHPLPNTPHFSPEDEGINTIKIFKSVSWCVIICHMIRLPSILFCCWKF
jgi:hypothetical protein